MAFEVISVQLVEEEPGDGVWEGFMGLTGSEKHIMLLHHRDTQPHLTSKEVGK